MAPIPGVYEREGVWEREGVYDRDGGRGGDIAIEGFEVGAVDADDVTGDHGRDDAMELLDKLRI